MQDTIELFASIFLYADGRKSAFSNAYRPVFCFDESAPKTSGSIFLEDGEEIEPGQIATVKIKFIKGIIPENYFKKGQKFTFSEGKENLGEGEFI